MDTDSLADLATAQAAIDRVRVRLTAAPALTVVRAGEDLQAVLDRGGLIGLEAATWTGTYVLRSGTQLTGRLGSAIRGVSGPALIIPPGTRGVSVSTLECTANADAVILIGEDSDNQTTVEQCPRDITLTDVVIPMHRGKRGIENHGINTKLVRCQVRDCWDASPSLRDSQAVYTGNTPGPFTAHGGTYEAGSEVFLFGGDPTAIPHVTPSDILIEDVDMGRPLAWKTDGVQRKVKNIFEVKNGRRIIVRRCKLHGCWFDGYQQGEAFMFTPALDGDPVIPPLQSGDVGDILVEDCDVTDVSSGFNILGRHYTSYTPTALSNIVVRRLKLTASAAKFGGRGQLALIQAEPGTIAFEDVTAITDGSSLILYDGGDVLDPVTKKTRKGGKIGALTIVGSRANLGEYGLMLSGNPNARKWQESVSVLLVTDNTFGAGEMALPGNTYQAAPLTQ